VRVGDTATPGSATGDDDLFVESDIEINGIIYADGNSIYSSAAEALSLSNDDVSVVGCLNVGSVTECTTQGNIQASGDLAVNGGDITTTSTILGQLILETAQTHLLLLRIREIMFSGTLKESRIPATLQLVQKEIFIITLSMTLYIFVTPQTPGNNWMVEVEAPLSGVIS